jgi:HlyD family secretion protein
MKKIFIVVIIAAIVGIIGWQILARSTANAGNEYTFAEVKRGDIQSIISSTGTLQAVETVNVGTQVSGIIDRIFVDFNDKVKKGQLIALLDTSLLQVSVRDAEATVAKAQADLDQAHRTLDRNKTLYDNKLLSDQDYQQSLTNVESAQASLLSANAALDRAKINLNHAEIRSPIDGIVIERSVDAGQTVAASLSAPTLFIIARNLSKMQILAQADESDIGQIKVGQIAHFTVPAYPDQTFEGQVEQIRLQPETVSNVVLYTVVVSAPNKDDLLLPGMTATVDFVVQNVPDVLYVPNAALRFQPTEEMLALVRKNRPQGMQNLPDSLRQQAQSHFGTGGAVAAPRSGNSQSANPQKESAMLWYLDKNGSLQVTRVQTGATNGFLTQIVGGRNVEEGMKVISNVQQKSQKAAGENSSSSRPHGPRFF